ncbi:F-box domain-containing protein [Favolaschia claudopus]|uniref:F-box domain-containing protein n=1 Tax=Favolaschia claudopus TaxID=2862362 RepID=A0AAW0DCF8_9AGAR
MSSVPLPDEIISEILAPTLKISDELFSDTSEVSPFANRSGESTSTCLVVCKAWLRVATPLLYNTVPLRSKAQAKALSVALSGNKELGQFIKKLRVEGGYGQPMYTILQYAPNITDILLSLQLYSADNTTGLCKGLKLISPTRLILWNGRSIFREPDNKMILQLVNTLCQCIPEWNRLCIFGCPFHSPTARALKLVLPIAEAKRLRTLVLPRPLAVPWAYEKLKGCPLEVIQVKFREDLWIGENELSYEKNSVIMALVRYMDGRPHGRREVAVTPIILPSLNPSFVPLANVPHGIKDKILGLVLYFAMPDEEAMHAPAAEFSTNGEISPRLSLLLVSKTFHRLALPHYYAHVTITHFIDAACFISILAKYPSVGPGVRSLTFCSIYPEYDYPELENAPDGEDWASIMLAQTTGLLRFGGGGPDAPGHAVGNFEQFGMRRTSVYSYWNFPAPFSPPRTSICWEAFERLAKFAGSTLLEFSAPLRAEKPVSATIIDEFPMLQKLNWTSEVTFDDSECPSVDALANMNELWVTKASSSFLSLLTQMKLHSLRRLVYLTSECPNSFLEVHGAKLAELVICVNQADTLKSKIYTLCPNLSSISIYGSTLYPVQIVQDICPREMVKSLRKIILDLDGFGSDKNTISAWDTFFRKFMYQRDFNPGELQVKWFSWPTNERDIKKSEWVRWAEVLARGGLTVTDKAGTKWKPRLR